MKQSRVSAFGRVARSLALAAVVLVLGAGTLLAQATGKIEGRVRDQAGAPIANAQVFIVGTAFNALTNPQGYYFINNVPGGTIAVRAAFIGYKSTQVDGVKVLAGQTGTVDIQLEQTAVEIQEITVVSQTQPLVPRDEVTTKQRVDGAFADALPVDNLNQVLQLQPGVIQDTDGGTLRPRRPGERERHVHRRRTHPGWLPGRCVRRIVGLLAIARDQRLRRGLGDHRVELGRVRQRQVGHHLDRHQDRRQPVPGLPGLRDRRAVRGQQRRRLQPDRGRRQRPAGGPAHLRAQRHARGAQVGGGGPQQPEHSGLPSGRRGHHDPAGQHPGGQPGHPVR